MPRIKLTERTLFRIGTEEPYEDLMLRPGKMLLSETIAAEKLAKMTWPQIMAGVIVMQMQAVHAVVWVLRKRSNPKLQPHEVEFSLDELDKLDPDYMPEYWEVTDDPDGIEVDDRGNLVIPELDEPEQADEGPKGEPSPQPET